MFEVKELIWTQGSVANQGPIIRGTSEALSCTVGIQVGSYHQRYTLVHSASIHPPSSNAKKILLAISGSVFH